MLNLLIAEDDPVQQQLLLSHLRDLPDVQVVDAASTGDELIRRAMEIHDLTAMVLDLDLGTGKGGLECYSILKLRGRDLPAILVTGTAADAGYTYDLGIVDIVEKPYTAQRLGQAVEKLRRHLEYQRFLQDGGLYVPVYAQEIQQVTPQEILFIESLNRKVHVHTKQGTLETKIPVKAYEQYLKDLPFFLTHRSFLVNLTHIHYVEDGTIHFRDDERVALVTEEKVHDFQQVFAKVVKWL